MFTSWKDDVIKAYQEHCKYLSDMLVEESKFKFQLMDIISKLESELTEKTTKLEEVNSLLETYKEELKEKEINVNTENVIKNAISKNGIVKEKDYTKMENPHGVTLEDE